MNAAVKVLGEALANELLEGFQEKRDKFVADGADPAIVDQIFAQFKELKARHLLAPHEVDIDRYERFADLASVVADASQRQSKSQRKKLENPRSIRNLELASNNAKAIVVVPKSWEEATIAGQGTKWCVAMSELDEHGAYPGKAHWARYANDGVRHYMAQVKGRPSPWVEDHPELRPGETPKAEVVCWKLGKELGPGASTGGPGKYVFVPDIQYKVVYSTPPENTARDSTDAVIPISRFFELTGMGFDAFGKNAWILAKKAGVPFVEFAASVSDETWDTIGQATTLKSLWKVNPEEQSKIDPANIDAAWIEFWRQARKEIQDKIDPEDKEKVAEHKDFLITMAYYCDERLIESKARALADRLLEGPALLEDVYKLSSTQINLPDPLDDFVVKWGRMNVPDDDLYYDDDGGCGRETEPHITVLYGLTDAQPPAALLDILRRTKPFTVRLGPLSIFKNEEYDVLKFSVISDHLVDLANALKAACPNENKFPEYIPHCTVAYCKKGTVDHMEGVYPFEVEPPIPNEFEAWELLFKGAGDSEDPERVVKPLEFGGRNRNEAKELLKKLRADVVTEGRAKDFFKSNPVSVWSYQVEEDCNAYAPPMYHALILWRSKPAHGATNSRPTEAEASSLAERYIREFKRLDRLMPFDGSMNLWDWYWQAKSERKQRKPLGEAKDFIMRLGVWSYEIQDVEFATQPTCTQALFKWNGVPADPVFGVGSCFSDRDKTAENAEAFIRVFKRLDRVLPFRPGKYETLWAWYAKARDEALLGQSQSRPLGEAKDFIKQHRPKRLFVSPQRFRDLPVDTRFRVAERENLLKVYDDNLVDHWWNALDVYDHQRYAVKDTTPVFPPDWTTDMITSWQGGLGEGRAKDFFMNRSHWSYEVEEDHDAQTPPRYAEPKAYHAIILWNLKPAGGATPNEKTEARAAEVADQYIRTFKRLETALPFDPRRFNLWDWYRMASVDYQHLGEGRAKDFFKRPGVWSYQVWEVHYIERPMDYQAHFFWNGSDVGTGASFNARDKAVKNGEAYLREFKRLVKILPFRPGNYGNLWAWHTAAYEALYARKQARKQGLGEAKDFIMQVRGKDLQDDIDIAVRKSIGQTMRFELVPDGDMFQFADAIWQRHEDYGWNWLKGGYLKFGNNVIVTPVDPGFSPFDRVRFPEEASVLRRRLRQR